MDKIQLSNILHIQEASKQGRLVVFVGAGVSNNSGVPTWSTLIHEMKNECGADQETDDLKIAQLYKDARGEKEFMDKVKEVLQYNRVVPNEIHKAILDLNPCHIITTNYDNLIEQEIENEFKQFAIIREDKDLPNMSYPNCLVKMHGDFETNNIVLTESDYYNYGRNYPLIRSYVLSLFASKLVVFIGFSFADLNLKMILNDLRSVLHDSMQKVYLISDTKPTQILTSYYEGKGINVVYLEESDIVELTDSKDNHTNLTDSKGIYLLKVLNCIDNVRRDYGKDLASILYARLKEYKNELTTVGDGLQYLIPQNEGTIYNPHSDGLQLYSQYFKDLKEQLKTFGGKRKFISEHPEINLKELKEIAFNNYLYKIDDVVIVDPIKQFQLFKSTGAFSALWHYYQFDFNNLEKRILFLSTRDLSGDYNDLEYPFILYKTGNYIEAYNAYNRIMPTAWTRKKYILYFICLYNLCSIKNGVYSNLMLKDEKVADIIYNKLFKINLDEVLARLPISDGIRKTFQDLLSFRSLGKEAVQTEDRREEIYKQRKLSEKGGYSINSNIQSLISKFERTFQFCNNNYIVCDNNQYYQSIGYNTACGILNSYATPDFAFQGKKMTSTKIDKLSSYCVFVLVFFIEPQKLKDIFNRYEIESIELTEEAIESLNEYWTNLNQAVNIEYINGQDMNNCFENLIRVTSYVSTNGIKQEVVYDVILKYWDRIRSFKMNGYLLDILMSNMKPSKEKLFLILDKLISNLKQYDMFNECYKRIAYYLQEMQETYNLDMTKLKDGKYASELFHLYKVVNPVIKDQFSTYCQNNLQNVWEYLDFIVNNQVAILSIDDFRNKIKHINDHNNYHRYCCWILNKMRQNEQYSGIFSLIDKLAQNDECLKFYLSPLEYEKKEQVDADWIVYTNKDFVSSMAKIPEYKEILKKYLIENKFLSSHFRNKILQVL